MRWTCCWWAALPARRRDARLCRCQRRLAQGGRATARHDVLRPAARRMTPPARSRQRRRPRLSGPSYAARAGRWAPSPAACDALWAATTRRLLPASATAHCSSPAPCCIPQPSSPPPASQVELDYGLEGAESLHTDEQLLVLAPAPALRRLVQAAGLAAQGQQPGALQRLEVR
jgi:hypothetical protein